MNTNNNYDDIQNWYDQKTGNGNQVNISSLMNKDINQIYSPLIMDAYNSLKTMQQTYSNNNAISANNMQDQLSQSYNNATANIAQYTNGSGAMVNNIISQIGQKSAMNQTVNSNVLALKQLQLQQSEDNLVSIVNKASLGQM